MLPNLGALALTRRAAPTDEFYELSEWEAKYHEEDPINYDDFKPDQKILPQFPTRPWGGEKNPDATFRVPVRDRLDGKPILNKDGTRQWHVYIAWTLWKHLRTRALLYGGEMKGVFNEPILESDYELLREIYEPTFVPGVTAPKGRGWKPLKFREEIKDEGRTAWPPPPTHEEEAIRLKYTGQFFDDVQEYEIVNPTATGKFPLVRLTLHDRIVLARMEHEAAAASPQYNEIDLLNIRIFRLSLYQDDVDQMLTFLDPDIIERMIRLDDKYLRLSVFNQLVRYLNKHHDDELEADRKKKLRTLLHHPDMASPRTNIRFVFSPLEDPKLVWVLRTLLDLGWSATPVMSESDLTPAEIAGGNAGATPLFFAAKYSNLPAVELLTNAGADLEQIVEDRGWTPLLAALMFTKAKNESDVANTDAIVRRLATPRTVNMVTTFQGHTPLMWAVANSGASTVRMLVSEYHADVKLRDKYGGKTALYYALNRSPSIGGGTHVDIIEALLDCEDGDAIYSWFGAQVGMSAVRYALEKRNLPDVAEFFKAYEAERSPKEAKKAAEDAARLAEVVKRGYELGDRWRRRRARALTDRVA